MESDGRAQRVADVLRGRASYDSLAAEEQSEVRDIWAERIEESRASLDYERAFRSEGQPYVELGDDGLVRRVEP